MADQSRIWRTDFPKTTNPLKYLWFASRRHWIPIVIAAAMVVAGSTLQVSISYVFKLIANAAAGLGHGGSYDALLFPAILYIIISLAAELCYRASSFAGALWANNARATGRHALTAYVTLHSRAYFLNRFAGSLSGKISHASNGIRDLVEIILWQFLEFLVAVIASFVVAFLTSPIIAFIFLAWVATVVVINYFFARRRLPLSYELQGIETSLNGATVDLLSNITAMQEYARRFFEIERIKRLIERRRRIGLKTWRIGEAILTINGFIQAIFATILVVVTVWLAQAGVISVGDIVLVVTLIFRIEGYMLMVGRHLNSFAEKWGEISESLEEILEPHEIPDKPDARRLKVSEGKIDFESVRFSYAGKELFKELTLRIPGGQRVGLVGRSGAGKSSFLRLLLHHHDIASGSIKVDGIDISAVTQDSLRGAISVVPQESLLFHRTVWENIGYGNPDATRDEIVEAAKQAQAHEFITRLSDGYNTLVGERGIKLSGGERQRIVIARAILKNAPILLLDEATASLDSESEVAIQKALSQLMKGKTVIAIAHRLSTLREMDRIIVMDRGDIVEEGTHTFLVNSGGIYSELWGHQVGGFVTQQ